MGFRRGYYLDGGLGSEMMGFVDRGGFKVFGVVEIVGMGCVEVELESFGRIRFWS